VPEVAVVIPAYNPGPHLARSLGSVIAQQFTDWECVVVDDGSTDPVDLDALASLADDARVRLHRQPNAGVSVARNVGVGLTDSRWVAFLDQDDEWHPAKLRRQLEGLEASPRAAFSHTGFVWSLPTGAQASREVQVTYQDLLAGRAHVLLSSLVVRRDAYVAVGGNDPLLRQQQDWALALNLCRLFGPPAHDPDALVTYVVHEANASRDYALAAAEARWVLEGHRAAADAAGDTVVALAAREGLRHTYRLHARQGVENARQAKDRGDWRRVVGHLGAAARLDPAAVVRAGADTVSARTGQLVRRASS
jgi:glycosyltransferase involved in cell wall biosynthesis